MQALAQLTRAVADTTRLHILDLLCTSEATVNDLATRLGLPQPRVSSHLALLRQAGLVSVHVLGRQRTYRVDVSKVKALFAALYALTPSPVQQPPPSSQAAREIRRNSAIRQGRSCYDHLAGVAGVELLDTLLARGWLTAQEDGKRSQYMLTPAGEEALQARGLDLARLRQARRRFAYGCLDWTERRPHLGGVLGSAILEGLKAKEIVARQTGSRILLLKAPLTQWLDTPAGSVLIVEMD
jgi:DNA-binding transcriptional ArsR family regulator/DNA-binding PadR family transcriptional regulator